MHESSQQILFRDFKAKDAITLCALLGQTFKKEYLDQGLNIQNYKIKLQFLGLLNIFLRRIHLEFFKMWVVEKGEKIVGCVGGYPIAKEVWYMGFAAMAPRYRGKHIFRSLLKTYFQSLFKTRVKAAYFEINPENHAPIKVVTEYLQGKVLSTKKIYILNPGRRYAFNSSRGQFQKADSREKIYSKYSVKDLVPMCDDCLQRGFFRCLMQWVLPPTIYKSFVYKYADRNRLFIRCRIQLPGDFWSVDTLWYDSQMNQRELEQLINELLTFLCANTRNPVKIYIDDGERRMSQILEKFGLTFFSKMSFIVLNRKDIE